MPRILHIINKLDLGGAEVMILDILRNSSRDEFDYHLLCPYGHGELDARAREYNINLHFLDTASPRRKLSLFSQGVQKIRELKPDLVHTHTRFSDMIGLYGGKLAGVKHRLITIHAAGMYFLDSKPIYEGIIEYGVIRYATQFVVISNGVARYLNKFGNIPFDKITVIYNGIDPYRVCPPQIQDRSQIRDLLKIPRSEYVVVAVGRLVPEKGFDILLDEFKLFRERKGLGKFLLIGTGPEEGNLRSKIAKLGIQEHATLVGRSDNLADMLRASDCFVLSSRKEGFGNVILEAMANGVPVAASNVGGVPEIVTDMENGLLYSIREQGALASAIEKIQSNKSMSEKMAEKAKKMALEKFNVKNTADKYEALYRKLITGQQ